MSPSVQAVAAAEEIAILLNDNEHVVVAIFAEIIHRHFSAKLEAADGLAEALGDMISDHACISDGTLGFAKLKMAAYAATETNEES